MTCRVRRQSPLDRVIRVVWVHDGVVGDVVMLQSERSKSTTTAGADRSPLRAEIDRVKSACVRRDREIQEVFDRMGGPPSDEAALNKSTRKLLDKQERARKWLAILLRKHGLDRDLALASAVESGAWP